MLTQRQIEVLHSIVSEYIRSGESVGSRTVSKRYLTGHSAATIRNEMSDLEEMGFLIQPHTSAGRVPTTKAYRLYVDSVLKQRENREKDVQGWPADLSDQRKGTEGAMTVASDLLSRLSKYVGVVAVEPLNKILLHRVDFIRVDSQHLLLLVILEGGLVHHKIVPLVYNLSQDSLEELSRRINFFAGRPWAEARGAIRTYVDQELREYAQECRRALAELDELISTRGTKLYTGSMSHLLDLPDFQDLGRFQALFTLLEQEHELLDLVNSCTACDGVNVLIGEEIEHQDMKDCSLMFSSSTHAGQRTVLGIIGPKRMDYERALTVLDQVFQSLSESGIFIEEER